VNEECTIYTPVDKSAVREDYALNGILRGIDPDTQRPDEMLRPSAFPFGREFKRIDGELVQTYPQEVTDNE